MSLLKKILCGFLCYCAVGYAEEFVIHNIRVMGLQRISTATVLNNLPPTVQVGKKIDTDKTGAILRALYKTDFFSDITLKRQGNELIIQVVERPVIGAITVLGNHKLSKKQLEEGLKNVRLLTGQALDSAMLNAIVQAIIQQYYNLGFYGVKVIPQVTALERNRVAVTIQIKEGPVAKIRAIKIVGNKTFKEKTLLQVMHLSTPKLWSFLTDSDKYSEEKLAVDIERLRAYYMDRGYLNFTVVSKRVTITPDKRNIYITLVVAEGKPFKIKGFKLTGRVEKLRLELLQLITLKPGELFSRAAILLIQRNMEQLLSNVGYGMPTIRIEPVVDEQKHEIFVNFNVDIGSHIYVHNINFAGNVRTHDEVLRREMRQQEGALFSLEKINESRRRLAVLGYLKDVDYLITPLAKNDQVDITYKVKESSSIEARLQGGYSDADGFLYGANIKDNNLLGTGKMAALRMDNSSSTQYYSLGYNDPYFTRNNISLSVEGYLQKSNLDKLQDLVPYSTNIYGAIATLGIPLSDYTRLAFGGGAEHIKIMQSANSTKEVKEFVGLHGSLFDQLKFITKWSYSNVDKIPFTTKGFSQEVGGELYLPLNKRSLKFYKIDYRTLWYQPLFKGVIFRTTTEVGYGNGFGNTATLPFFKNFFAGGIGTVRGFESGSIGPQEDKKAVGGNLIAVGSASLIIPTPLPDSVRTSIFVDVGSVYKNRFVLDELRSSVGIQVEWLTPFGAPLVFSLATPIYKKSYDYPDTFQFTIGFSTW